MKVCKKKCWMTEDRKSLVADGEDGAAFLAGIPGQEVADVYVKHFENGSDFFEDVKRHVEPAQNIPVSHHESVEPGATNKRGKAGLKEKVTDKSSKEAAKQLKQDEATEQKFLSKQK
jgi:hypothetical protein